LSTGGEGAGGDRPVGVGEVPDAADDRRAPLYGDVADGDRRPCLGDRDSWRRDPASRRRIGDVRCLRHRLARGFIDDAPDRARFEAALEHRLLAGLGELPLFGVLEADRDELERRVVDGDEGAARECLQLILEDAAEDLRVGGLAVAAQL
jgi:hypothetical protein